MKTILINISTSQPASKVFEGRYKVDGQIVSAEELAKQGLIELEYIDTQRPAITATQIATHTWQVTENGYEKVWAVREKTEQELAIEDWDCPEFDNRLTVPIEFAEVYPSIKVWADLNPEKLAIVKVGDYARVYFNELKENHNDIVLQNNLVIEQKPF